MHRDFASHPWVQEPKTGPDIYVLVLDSTSRDALQKLAPKVRALFDRPHHHHVAQIFRKFHTINKGIGKS